MLLLLQAAEPVLTSGAARLYVTLQQPAGLPEWLKITITAAVGTAFGITASILVETVKPWIALKLGRRSARKQLLSELSQNITAIDGYQEFIEKLGKTEGREARTAHTLVNCAFVSVTTKLFDFHVSDRKDVVYGLSFFTELDRLCRAVNVIRDRKSEDFDTELAAFELERIKCPARERGTVPRHAVQRGPSGVFARRTVAGVSVE
jgi:hypothetical protein